MDNVTKDTRSRIMSKVRSKGNRSTELRLISLFKSAGIKGWRRCFPLPGSPDFVFPGERVCVFVDGCFWHGCPKHCRLPKTRRPYWIAKIARNSARDKQTARILRRSGWTIIRVWEHEIAKNNLPRRLTRVFPSAQVRDSRKQLTDFVA